MQCPALIQKMINALRGFCDALLDELERQYMEGVCLWNGCQYDPRVRSVGHDNEGGYTYTYTCERCQIPVTIPERHLHIFQRTHGL